MKYFNIIGILVIIAVLVFLGIRMSNTDSGTEPAPADSPAVAFEWGFDFSGAETGAPQTDIALAVEYENGDVVSEYIDTGSGSCNAIDPTEEDTDMVSGTEKIQCYSAGLGQRYKIVQVVDSYHVMRKIFEEALPGYTPPDYQYEMIAQFPLYQ